jgi:hypothetical protein
MPVDTNARARSAFQKALADQMAPFATNAPVTR